jgi:hypothetical protein
MASALHEQWSGEDLNLRPTDYGSETFEAPYLHEYRTS